MKQVISTEKKPIKLWLEGLEPDVLQQASNLANLPFTFRHVALMPDAHTGYGMPIGGVLATKGAVIPNAVGMDIGCGMCAVKTNLTDLSTSTMKKIMMGIRQRIPLGFDWHKEKQDESLMPQRDKLPTIVEQQYKKALLQIGTLGGGNHFIEIQRGTDNHIWIMIHSGSRNIGKQVADHYNKVAKRLNARWHSQVPSSWDLAFLPIETNEAHDYLDEMNYCIDFALANRKLMMEFIMEIFHETINQPVHFFPMINIAHNYATWEHHFGENVLIHRKGATRAQENETGIIPGSQGSRSYIVQGLGNKESFHSCSHGAGRKMGRRQAQRQLDLQEEIKQLNKQGIIHAVRNPSDLDEAPGAYKDIHTVMNNQKDLVKIIEELHPLAVVKG
ncbi:RtcB family protein [Puteibacter caeruleilacunae]|nr:RtcB family protein [Puteibacter caeruleilacunae]